MRRKTEAVKFRLTSGERAALRLISVDENESMSEVVRKLIHAEAERRGFPSLAYLAIDESEGEHENPS